MKTKLTLSLFVLFSTLSFAQCPNNTGLWQITSVIDIDNDCSNSSTGIIDFIPNASDSGGVFTLNSNVTFNNNGEIRIYYDTDSSVNYIDGIFNNYGTFRDLTYQINSNNSNNSINISQSGIFNNHTNSLFKNHGQTFITGVFNNNGQFDNHSKINLNYFNNKSGGVFANLTPDNHALGENNFFGKFHNFLGAQLFNLSSARFVTQIINEGIVNNSGAFYISYIAADSSNSGTFNNLADGSFQYNNSTSFFNIGTFNNDGDFLVNNNSRFINNGTFNRTQPGGKTLINNGTFINNNILYDADGSSTINNGIWGGNSTFHEGSFINNGTIAPGDYGIGTYHFNNAYTHLSTATTNANFEIGGTTNYDQVTAGANIDLQGGTLNLNFVNGYTPTSDEQYTIMTATSGVTGTFATVNFPSGFEAHMTITYNPNSVVINFIAALSTQDFNNQEFKLYPNPVNTQFQLKTPSNFEFKSLKVIDENGKVVKQFSTQQENYSIFDLSNGVYYILIDGSASQKLKLIKN